MSKATDTTSVLVKTPEAARLLGCDPDTLRSLARRGKVPHTKLGASYFFARAFVAERIRQAHEGVTSPSGSDQAKAFDAGRQGR